MRGLEKPAIVMDYIHPARAQMELRLLREKAERSAEEIRKALLKWQAALGHGKFKEAYMAAGWTRGQINYYLYEKSADESTETCQQVADSEEANTTPTDSQEDQEDEPDEMPVNPRAQQCEEVSRRLTDLGFGEVKASLAIHGDADYEITFYLTIEETESLIQALKARRIPSRKSTAKAKEQVN
jgi:hypothetical protein